MRLRNMKTKEIVAARLRAVRCFEGLTQEQMATRMGVCFATISHYETGRRKPSLDFLARFARSLDVSTDYLLGSRACDPQGWADWEMSEIQDDGGVFLDSRTGEPLTEQEVKQHMTDWVALGLMNCDETSN